MSSLPKHLRPRYRYLAIAITAWPTGEITHRAFQRDLWRAARSLVGDVGSATTDLTLIKFSLTNGTGEAIVRTRRESVTAARAAIACLTEIDSAPIGIYVQGISGTVRACEEKYLGQDPESVTERQVAFEGASRTAFVHGDRAEIRVKNAFTGATDLDFEDT